MRIRRVNSILIGVIFAASGCSGTSSSLTPSGPAASGASSEQPIPAANKAIQAIIDSTTPDPKQYPGVTITVAGDSIQSVEPFIWFAPAIKKKFGITVKSVGLPFDTFYQALQNDIVSGTGAYDVLSYPPRFNGDLAAAGDLVNLDSYASQWDPNLSDVFPVYRDLYDKWNGHLIALTFDGDRLELYYRKDLFDNAAEKAAFKTQFGYDLAPPQTWDQYLDVAKFFTRKAGSDLAGGKLTQPFYGLAEITRLPDNFDWFLNRFAAYGGVYFNAQMQPQLDTAAGKSALTNFISAVKYGPPGILNFEYPESFAAYLQGQTAMCIQWTDVAKSAEDPSSSKVVGKTGYAQIPGAPGPNGQIVHRSTLAYSRVDAISKLSKNPEAAYRVIQFMSQPDVALAYTTEPNAGIDPFRPSTYSDPSKWVEHWPTVNDYIANNKLSIINGYPELTIPGAYRYDQALGQHVAKALAGQETVDQALQGATSDWNAITDDLGRDGQVGFWKQQLEDWKTLGLITNVP